MGQAIRAALMRASETAAAGQPQPGPMDNKGLMPGMAPKIDAMRGFGGGMIGGGMRSPGMPQIAQPAPNPQQQAQINRTHPPNNPMVKGPMRQPMGMNKGY